MSNERETCPVDTRKVARRRTLRFDSIDAMLTEVDRLVGAERAAALQQLGNWTLGQALAHLAVWAEFSYTGAPIHAPFLVKWIMRFRKRRVLYRPMQPGFRIPGIKAGTLATEATPLDEASARIRHVMQRLKVEAPTAPNLVFGPLKHEEWIALNLRHAELHLSFFIPA